MHLYLDAHVKAKGQLVGAGFLFPPSEFGEVKFTSLAWWQVPLAAESSHF